MSDLELILANPFLTLATADADGRPWASPVWYAVRGSEFFWASKPGARHSRNIAVRPQVALVVREPDGPGALYADAVAAEVPDLSGLDVYNGRSAAAGLRPWTEADLTGPARHRFYRAVATELSTLDDHDERQVVSGQPAAQPPERQPGQ